MLQAMSQANVELVRAAFESFNTQGIDAALPFFRPDAVWYPTSQWLEDSAYRGHEGIRELAAAFSHNFDGLAYAIHEVRDADERVVAHIEMTARIRNSGQPISQPLGLLVSGFRDGAFTEVRAFPSWAEALDAAGVEQ